jgi:diguanylate cyclase (GGDEF)-like protein
MAINANEQQVVTSALLASTAHLATESAPDAILHALAESLTKATSHIRLAWLWFGNPQTQVIHPMISVGPAKAYIGTSELKRNFLTLVGPAYQALHADCTVSLRFDGESIFTPWREAVHTHGLRAAMCVPLKLSISGERGLLVFYADAADYFDLVGAAPFEAFARLAEAVLAQAHLRDRLTAAARTDALTGLENRGRMTERLCEAHATSSRYGESMSLIYLDIDHFKRVNDTYGHAAGDTALAEVASVIQDSLRDTDFAGRWGGEEFVVILQRTSRDTAMAVAERMRAAIIELEVRHQGMLIRIAVSAGVATYPEDATSLHALLDRADNALYAAKRSGRNRVIAADALPTAPPAPQRIESVTPRREPLRVVPQATLLSARPEALEASA